MDCLTVEYDGRSYVAWSVDDLKAAGVPDSIIQGAELERKWEVIREKRQLLMFKTDWTQSQDSPLVPEKLAEFAVYRQALRDIPQNTTNPDDVVWPEKPTI